MTRSGTPPSRARPPSGRRPAVQMFSTTPLSSAWSVALVVLYAARTAARSGISCSTNIMSGIRWVTAIAVLVRIADGACQ